MNKETKAALLRRLVTEAVDQAMEEAPVPVSTAESQNLSLFIDEENGEYTSFILVATNRTLQRAQSDLARIADYEEKRASIDAPLKLLATRAAERGADFFYDESNQRHRVKDVLAGKSSGKGFDVDWKMFEIVAEVMLEMAPHSCGGYIVYTGAAGKGYGPLIYDIAMAWATPRGGMMSSRNSIKPGARSLWVHYFQRSDVKKVPLIKNPLRRLEVRDAPHKALAELPCEFADEEHGNGMTNPLELQALNHKYFAKNPVDYKKLEENGKRLLLQLQHMGYSYEGLLVAIRRADKSFFQRRYY